MLPLTVKGKKVFCSGMTTDTQLRKRDTEGFCDNPYPTTPTKSNGLKRKPSKSSQAELGKNSGRGGRTVGTRGAKDTTRKPTEPTN